MKEYTNSYRGKKLIQDTSEGQFWKVDLYDGETLCQTMTGLEREMDANAVITTSVVQEGWTAVDKTEETDPVDWDDPLFVRDFIIEEAEGA